jgi:hypothetical protein
MTSLFQHRDQLAEIVDFAIEHQPDLAILIRHWLVPGWREILNGQATKTKTDARSTEISLIIRATMLLYRRHLAQEGFSSKIAPVQL